MSRLRVMIAKCFRFLVYAFALLFSVSSIVLAFTGQSSEWDALLPFTALWRLVMLIFR